MIKRVILATFVLVLLGAGSASAQTCPLNGTSSSKLVCLIPQVYGPFGLGTTSDPTQSVLDTGLHHNAHFENDFVATFSPINEAVGIQVSQLPTASPSSGISFHYDSSLKTFVPSTDESLGPIIGERASTIGRNKFFLGFSYQYFSFTTIDGQDMGKIPSILQHQPFPPPFPVPSITSCPNQTNLTGAYAQNPCFVRDFINTSNDINLTAHQYTIYATYGLTKHLDISAAIPLLDVRMSVTSTATIVPNSAAPTGSQPGNVFHEFNPNNPVLAAQCAQAAAAGQACLTAKFTDSGSAAGIGDVVLRGKYTVYRGEHLGFAGGIDFRLPTGDDLNFLGSGSLGVKPFGIVSYSARISPHAEVGFEWNGDSTLAGQNLVPGQAGGSANKKGPIPNRFIYIVGADVAIAKRLTGAFDIYGQRLFNSPELISQPYTDLGNCSGPTNAAAVACAVFTNGTTHPDVAEKFSDINITNASLGLKFRPFGHFVLTGNVLLKLDNGGLRARAIPLVGASYSF
jgi:hypothetical protein